MEAHRKQSRKQKQSGDVYVEYATQICNLARLVGFQYKDVCTVIILFICLARNIS